MTDGGGTIPSPVKNLIDHVERTRKLAQQCYETARNDFIAGHWFGVVTMCNDIQEKIEDEIIANLYEGLIEPD